MAASINNFIDINSDFFSEVRDRFTDKETGELLDPQIVERLAHPICIACQETYQKKYPKKPFAIKCQGIRTEQHYAQIAEEAAEIGISLDEVKEVQDASVWSNKYLVVKNSVGDIVPFEPREYQKEMLKCTASHKVDRMGRGTGKSLTGVAEELWYCTTRKNFNTLVLCPAQAQSEMWYAEIMFQKENSPAIRNAIISTKQQPYYQFRFANGSSIYIFTAGSKSGKGADSVRGQSPDRVRLDEQDFLNEKDYDAVGALIRRKKHTTFHGSSTPTGARGQFWYMCTQFTNYREFYYPISVHPDWNAKMEETCIREAKTMERYRHEYLAEFGDPATGVFKAAFVDKSVQPYKYINQVYDPSKRYYMGVDWNGKGTGTRICILEYDTQTRVRRKVATLAVDSEGSTTTDSINSIIKLNRAWNCDEVFIDAGFGFSQGELIKLAGKEASDPSTAKLKHAKSINFGGTLEFNTLVPNRGEHGKKTPSDDDQVKRRTKPFMVEGCVMAFEMGLVEISAEDKILEEQLRAYQVATWTKDDAANTYKTTAELGDHDLDAFMLAMLAIELKYGIWHTPDTIRRLAKIAYTGGFGIPGSDNTMKAVKETFSSQSNFTSRTNSEPSQNTTNHKLLYLTKNSLTIAPTGRSNSGGRVPSRTNIFGPTRRRF